MKMNTDSEILFEEKFYIDDINKIIRISSLDSLRIYYGEDLPILFSAMIGYNLGYINMYISSYEDQRRK